MAFTATKLGYGNYGIAESDTFARICKEEFYDTEEVRFDFPSNFNAGFSYVGLAFSGSDTSLPVWNCIRCTWLNGKQIRRQYQAGMVWDDRQNGWN